MLVATGLTKSYGDVHALRGADLDVESGQIVALLGKNGAGKTTMISIIAGLLKADSGTVILDGFDAQADLDRASKLIGIAPQDTGIYGVLTVRENLEFFANLAGVTSNRRSAEATNVAERLGLTDLLERRASKLSGGEARRLHTGCALVHEPKLLMLDEPTVGADVATRAQLIDSFATPRPPARRSSTPPIISTRSRRSMPTSSSSTTARSLPAAPAMS